MSLSIRSTTLTWLFHTFLEITLLPNFYDIRQMSGTDALTDVVFTYCVLYTLLHTECLKLCINMTGRSERRSPFWECQEYSNLFKIRQKQQTLYIMTDWHVWLLWLPVISWLPSIVIDY